jgi:hypothetical protein
MNETRDKTIQKARARHRRRVGAKARGKDPRTPAPTNMVGVLTKKVGAFAQDAVAGVGAIVRTAARKITGKQKLNETATRSSK